MRPLRHRVLLGYALFAVLTAASASGKVAGRPPSILLLTTDPHSAPGVSEFAAAVDQTVSLELPSPTTVGVEHLDTVYVNTPEYHESLVSVHLARYAEHPPDIVVAVGLGALHFALEEKPRVFPNASIVVTHIQKGDLPIIAGRTDTAAVIFQWRIDEVLETALRVLPATRRVVLVLGSGPFERRYEAQFRSTLARFSRRVELDWWVGLPMTEVEKRAAALRPGTIVLYLAVYRDSTGATFVPTFSLERLTRSSAVPVFGINSQWVGHGVVGDGRMSPAAIGAGTGRAVARLARGETTRQVGVVFLNTTPPVFDARQLERWGIPRSRLPAGSTVRFEPPSLWKQHRTAVLLGVAAIVVQALLLVSLLAQRVRRRRAEEGERESRRSQTSLIDSLDVAIVMLARDGTIIESNRAWQALAAQRQVDLGLAVGDNFPAFLERLIAAGYESLAEPIEAVRAVLTAAESFRRVEYFTPGQEGRRTEMRVVSRAGNGALVTVEDVTDRWHSEEAVRLALASLPIATILFDGEGRIELANREAERLFGYEKGALTDSNVRELLPFDAILGEWLEDQRSIGEPGTGGSPGVVVRNRHGAELLVEPHLRRITMRAGVKQIVSLVDLTERRRVEREIQRLRDETAHFGRVAAIGEMSAAIAHELNQPLTGILTNSQAAVRSIEAETFTPADLCETLGDIVADTRRAGEVIQRLRLMLRKGPMEISAVDVNEMVQQVARVVAHDLSLRGAAMDLELTEGLPPVRGDRVHLQQVLLNLVLNGADAMIAVPPQERRLSVRTSPNAGRTVAIEVRDAGPGIAPEAMPQMFKPFFTTKPHGLGMGLSIVRSIVETHEGRISCSNAPSGGAVFTLVLPVDTGAA